MTKLKIEKIKISGDDYHNLIDTNRTYMEMINSLVEDIDFWKRKYNNKCKENQVLLGQMKCVDKSSQYRSSEFSKDMKDLTVVYVDDDMIPTFRARETLLEEINSFSKLGSKIEKQTMKDPSTFKGDNS